MDILNMEYYKLLEVSGLIIEILILDNFKKEILLDMVNFIKIINTNKTKIKINIFIIKMGKKKSINRNSMIISNNKYLMGIINYNIKLILNIYNRNMKNLKLYTFLLKLSNLKDNLEN